MVSHFTSNGHHRGNNELIMSFVAISAHGFKTKTKGVGTLVNADLKKLRIISTCFNVIANAAPSIT